MNSSLKANVRKATAHNTAYNCVCNISLLSCLSVGGVRELHKKV